MEKLSVKFNSKTKLAMQNFECIQSHLMIAILRIEPVLHILQFTPYVKQLFEVARKSNNQERTKLISITYQLGGSN